MSLTDSIDDLLRQMSSDFWFGGLDVHERRVLLSSFEPMNLLAGEYVFRKDDQPDGIYGLVNGVLKASTLREDGKEAILAVLEAGNWFGESSVIDGMPRGHDFMALVPSRVLHVQQQHCEELLRHSTFARALARLQSMHLRAVYAMLEDATLRSTRARVARRLRRLASGDATPRSTERHAIPITQENLAMMLGISRQTLVLELKVLAAHGAISIGYGRVKIESMGQLREFELDP
ncbi:Crp/Fnr family transcriptional regulator [Paraburkholderia sp. IMGN_8]|uniref:Crp/Fnr family transcriptional regulator n=1 Tax=Paraburkholderia sp. IMGN_8 TaxID=3136564 RepID=UPI00310180B5